jgi:phage terminase large subunit-like protein
MSVIKVPALVRNQAGELESTFPHRMSTAQLMSRRREMGTIKFNNQYMLSPTNLAGNFLKAEWIHGYPWSPDIYQWPSPSLGDFSAIYCGVDPKGAVQKMTGGVQVEIEKDDTDYAVIAIGGVRNSQLWPFRLIRDRLSTHQLKEKLIELNTLYRFHRIAFESNAAQAFMAQFVAESTWLPIEPVQSRGEKSIRFSYMSGPFEAARVLIPMTSPTMGFSPDVEENPCKDTEFEIFFDEWIGFPNSDHDDTLDAMNILLGVAMSVPEFASSTSDQILQEYLAERDDPAYRSHVFEKRELHDPGLSWRTRTGGLTKREKQAMGLSDPDRRSYGGRLTSGRPRF